eukprot:NODE_22367_length_711_cov_5.205479.p1 GENE.NODE_22367_length_711_cov_5.205479~~NODE_22367_length_711_cov_5.205479.p1  ORF type:complete len:143 (+),score=37.87 NODE_22367_length_711_cov_5.205479:110-538(+)
MTEQEGEGREEGCTMSGPPSHGALGRPVVVNVTFGGKRLAFDTRTDRSVGWLLQELQRETGLVPSRQQLICSGLKLVEPNQRFAGLLPRQDASELKVILLVKPEQITGMQRIQRQHPALIYGAGCCLGGAAVGIVALVTALL